MQVGFFCALCRTLADNYMGLSESIRPMSEANNTGLTQEMKKNAVPRKTVKP